ncbi:MAG: hypothetical protein WC208_08310 [Gallionella sp.]|jgi:hypothetical protein
MEKVKITVDELRQHCPECAEKVEAKFGKAMKKVLVSPNTMVWLKMDKADRPLKEWWDKGIEVIGKVEDPAAVCSWIYHKQKATGVVPITKELVEDSLRAMKMEADISKLKKDIETIAEWQKDGASLTKEQRVFAEKVVDRMSEFKMMRKAGVQLVSRSHMEYLRKFGPAYGNTPRGITQDVVANGPADDGIEPRVSKEVIDVTKAAKDIPSKENGDNKIKLPESATQTGFARQTPDIPNIKLNPPDNQKEGEATEIADAAEKVDEGKATASDGKIPEVSEEIGHNPDEPMPKKMAQELIANAQWGVEIRAYSKLEEGIQSQLGRKTYAEFVDTPEKLASVIAYLKQVAGEVTDPKAQV